MNDILNPPNSELTHAPQVPLSDLTLDQLEYEALDHLTWAKLLIEEASGRTRHFADPSHLHKILFHIHRARAPLKEE